MTREQFLKSKEEVDKKLTTIGNKEQLKDIAAYLVTIDEDGNRKILANEQGKPFPLIKDI